MQSKFAVADCILDKYKDKANGKPAKKGAIAGDDEKADEDT